jgi:hypothetical protein
MRRTLLMVCFYFPPCGGVAVQRSLKFAKYLGEFGWDPLVITESVSAFAHLPQDPDLLNELDDRRVVVVRTSNKWRSTFYRWIHRLRLAPAVYFLTPIDMHFLWSISAFLAAARLLRRMNVDAVYTTSPPASAHLVGLLFSVVFRKPWVADFRDPWTHWHSYKAPSRLHRWFDKLVERCILKKASLVLCTSSSALKTMIREYGLELAARIKVLTNGYDPEDLPPFTPTPLRTKLLFTYAGTLYGNYGDPSDKLFPRPFFEALETLITNNPDIAHILEIRLVGEVSESNARVILEKHLENVVTIVGVRSHRDALSYLVDSDANLVLLRECQRDLVPAKLFEMVGVGRPIVAVVPDGDARDICIRVGVPYIACSEEVSEIVATFERVLGDWQSGKLSGFRYNESVIRCFTRKSLTEQLVGYLTDLVNSSQRDGEY